MLILTEKVFRCLSMSMKSSFSMKLVSKAARMIKGDHTQVSLAKQPLGSHKENMILPLSNTDTAAVLQVWPLPICL